MAHSVFVMITKSDVSSYGSRGGRDVFAVTVRTMIKNKQYAQATAALRAKGLDVPAQLRDAVDAPPDSSGVAGGAEEIKPAQPDPQPPKAMSVTLPKKGHTFDSAL